MKQAFPCKVKTEFKDGAGNTVFRNEPGMTLRDYFAAKSMQAEMSNPSMSEKLIAKRAYAMADAMMAERSIK